MTADFRHLLRNSSFKYLWISQITSQLTIQIINFILLVYLYSITGSSLATSFLWVVYALPALMIGPIAAAMADMISRRKILMITNLAQAITVLLFSLIKEPFILVVYIAVFVYSFFNQFYIPAELSSLPALVEKKYFASANSMFFLTQQAAIVVGFGIAGYVSYLFGYNKTLLMASGLLFVACASASRLPKKIIDESLPVKMEKTVIRFFKNIYEGYIFIKNRKDVYFPFFLLIVMQMGLIVMMVNLPIISEQIFLIQAEKAGIKVVAPAGIGAAFAALTIPRLIKHHIRKKHAIEYSLALLSIFLLFLIFVLPSFDNSLKNIFYLATMFILGYGFLGVVIPSQTYLQEVTPGGLRGRVFGNFWFVLTVATIMPVIFSGTITEIFGIKILIFLMTTLILLILVASKKHTRKMIYSLHNIKP